MSIPSGEPKERSSAKRTLLQVDEPCPFMTSFYKSFDELSQRVVKLKLPSGWHVKIEDFVHVRKQSGDVVPPVHEIGIDQTLFSINSFCS